MLGNASQQSHITKYASVRIVRGSFPIPLIKYYDKSNIQEKRLILLYSSRLQFIIASKSGHQELNADDCITSTVKRTMATCMRMLCLQDALPREWSHPQ